MPSPALSLEGFLATHTIVSMEECHVSIADVAGAFLKADMNDFVVVKLQGPVVDDLFSIKYKKYVTQTKINKQAIYIHLKKPCMGH